MSYVDETLERVIAQNPGQSEFHQAGRRDSSTSFTA